MTTLIYILNYLFHLKDVMQMDKLSIVPEPGLNSAHEGESFDDPKGRDFLGSRWSAYRNGE